MNSFVETAEQPNASRAGERLPPVFPAMVTLVLASILFTMLPRIDMIVSEMFWVNEEGFVHSRNGLLIGLRDGNRLLPWFILIPIALMLIVPQIVAVTSQILPPPHQLLYVLAFYAIGPGLTVHAIKTVVGRARPHALGEFGGTAMFTPPWRITDQCVSSCSFISGESASAFAIVTLALLLTPRHRIYFLPVALVAAAAASLNRVAFGAHFLSDVVIAWAVMWLIAVVMWRWTARHAPYIDALFVRRFP